MDGKFRVGDTVVLECDVNNRNTKQPETPATSYVITVKNGTKVVKVDAQAMTEDSTGRFSYKYTIDGGAGTYYVTAKFTDGTDVQHEEWTFEAVDTF